MAIIQEWPAETSPTCCARRRWRVLPIILAALMLALTGPVPNGSAQQIEHQGSSTLELPPLSGKQQETIPQVTAPMQPGQNVLVIPRASRDFVGEWGGHLHLTRVLGGVPAVSDSIVSLAFGESNGSVLMQTTAFASRSSHILKTSA